MLINKATKNLLKKYKKQTIPNAEIGQTIFPLIIVKVSNNGTKIILNSISKYSISMLKQILSEINNGYEGYQIEVYNLRGQKIINE